MEVIPVLDGYCQDLPDDPRIHPIHLHQNRGMKNAINKGMAMARGEWVMRVDEHCLFAEGYDVTLASQTEKNWLVTPRRYFLNPDTWEVMDTPSVDYEKLIIDDKLGKFAGVRWTSRAEERKDIPIDETMIFQGSCVFMAKEWWDTVIKNLRYRYGDHYQDQTQMVFQTWQAGGKVMVNKNTWFAHKHRDFPRTHHYAKEKAEPGWKNMLDDYGEYYQTVIKPTWMQQ